MREGAIAALLIGIVIPASGAMAASAHTPAPNARQHPPTHRGGGGHGDVVLQAEDQEVDAVLQNEHVERLDLRLTDAHFVQPEEFVFTLVDMSLESVRHHARYCHPSGAVREVEAEQVHGDLLIRVFFRQPMSSFQVGTGGGFIVGAQFA